MSTQPDAAPAKPAAAGDPTANPVAAWYAAERAAGRLVVAQPNAFGEWLIYAHARERMQASALLRFLRSLIEGALPDFREKLKALVGEEKWKEWGPQIEEAEATARKMLIENIKAMEDGEHVGPLMEQYHDHHRTLVWIGDAQTGRMRVVALTKGEAALAEAASPEAALTYALEHPPWGGGVGTPTKG
jgi:hypothetical protein